MTNKLILSELAERMKANSNGSLLFFNQAGVTVIGDYPTLQDLKILHETNYKEFKKLIEFLYADEIKANKANADGSTDSTNNKQAGWDFANNLITTAGGVVSSIFGREMPVATTVQPQVSETQEKKDKTTLYIIIGIVVAILIFGVGFYLYKKK